MAYPLAAPFLGYSDAVISAIDRCDIQIYVTGRECEKYPAKQHAQRVAARLGAAHGLIYLAGQPTINLEDSDQSRPFRQRRYFYYITGVNEPDCHVTYDVRADLLTLYVPDFNLRRAIWMGPTLTVDEALRKYDVDRVRYFSSLRSDIERWADKQAQRGITSPIYILHPLHKPAVAALKGVPIDDERLLPAMDAARGVKDAHEIDMIRQANHVSGMAHRSVLEQIHRMSNEAEIHGLFLNTCVSQGARNQAYEIIAASGENAAVLHYQKNNDDLDGRQLVCLDAGAEWECYASDVTRTFPLAGEWPSAEAQNIYSVVERMQEECIQGIRPGARFLDLHLLAHKIAIEELMALGILRGGTIEEIRRSGASTIFFPHGLGHHVGLEVHDVSETSIMGLSASADDAEDDVYDSVLISETSFSPCTRSSPLLQEGMVVTVEPGIYFSRYALGNARSSPLGRFIDFDVAETYIPIGGVRIEDDILVTTHGYENLTTAPKGERMLQIIRTGSDL